MLILLPPRTHAAPPRSTRALLASLLIASWVTLLAPPTTAQDLSQTILEGQEPLLPLRVSPDDITLRARYVRQMRTVDNELALYCSGGVEIQFGSRTMQSNEAIAWITRVTDPNLPTHWRMDVFLAFDAKIIEPGGTVTSGRELFVSDLRSSGELIKLSDSDAADDLSRLPLYVRGQAARTFTAQGGSPSEILGPNVVRADEVRALRPPSPPAVIRYVLPDLEPAETPSGETVLTARGGVYFSRSTGETGDLLELRADNGVVFLSTLDPDDESQERDVSGELETGAAGARWESDLRSGLRAVYLEGDVSLSVGPNFIRAQRIFYDFQTEQALIIDGVFRAWLADRNIPLYLRADEIRRHSPREFSALNAKLTTDEFHTPHYHIGAERVEVFDRTPDVAGAAGRTGFSGTYTLYNATFNVDGAPLLWWPYARGNIDEAETPLRSFSTGWSNEFGASVETDWRLFSLMGVPPPEGYDANLRLDYFSRRGPAVGVDVDYERRNYFGLIRSYYINDAGEDDLGPLRRAQNEPDGPNRGRFLLRHKHYLPNNWEANVEFSYLSDPGFLETYERDEWFESKDQETAIYLKRTRGHEALTILTNWRMIEFIDQTEHLPEVTYRRIGDTLPSPVPWMGPLTLYHESRAGVVRRRIDERNFFEFSDYDNTGESGVTSRLDARQEIEAPLKLGPINITPFMTVRGTYWDQQPTGDGGLWRGFTLYGVRGATTLARVYPDVRSELLNIRGIRHVINPDFVVWNAHSTADSDEIWPFDEGVETIDGFYGAGFGVKQIFQTKRGVGEREKVTDLLTLNVEAGFFGDPQEDELATGWVNPLEPENSRTRNHVLFETIYRLSDTTTLLYDVNWDLNDRAVDRHNIALAIERSPRLSYVIGLRHAQDIDYTIVGGGVNYKLTEKHTVGTRLWYDIERDELGSLAVTYIRKLPRWYFAVNFETDEVLEDTTITVAVWPEGIPEWTLGSRRFTGLATSTGIRPY